MECWERAWHTNTHTHSSTNMCPLSQTIDISEKRASSKTCVINITENGRSWWKAAWSLGCVVKLCWVAVSSRGKLGLKPCLRPSTFRVRQEDIFLVCDGTQLNHWGRRLLTNHFQEVYTNRAIDSETTQDSYRLDLYRANWFDEYRAGPRQMHAQCWDITLAVETEAAFECRHVSQTFSALKAGFSWGTQNLSFYLSLTLVLSPTPSDVCVCAIDVLGQDWGNNTHKCWECLESAQAEETTKCFSRHKRKCIKVDTTTIIYISYRINEWMTEISEKNHFI